MSVPPFVQFRIIKDNSNSLKDEIITVTKANHDDWRVTHKSYFSQTETTMFLKKNDHVISYFYTVYDMLKIDNEKFQFVQLDAPCFPVTLVSRADVLDTNNFYKLVRVVEKALNNWPNTVRPWSSYDY
jgi:hypothetical protein